MTLAVEEQRIRSLLGRVEEVEDVANSLPKGDERRTRLLNVTNATLAEEATIRPTIAAKLLGLDEKTVRAWAEQGVLTIAQRRPRLLLDLMSVHDMSHRIQQLREAGKHQGLLGEIWRQLNDQALIESDDFQESLAQMRNGEGVVLYSPSTDIQRRPANKEAWPQRGQVVYRNCSADVATIGSSVGVPADVTSPQAW